MKTYHYKVVNTITNTVVLNSSLRQDFNGFSSESKAYMAGLNSKIDNNLSDIHKVITLEIV